ncbi:GNAT family N-acetyltransferase [uncultured Sphingomonas sp.]|uniref:GNAT family N-acetyltransferase n=1 Tax=uncultured Sphingomonas sp. TaxID=158754 RepID=UPI0035CC18AB
MFALTPRLMLRPGWPEDAPELARAIGHEDVVSRLARVPWPYAEADARWFLSQPRGAEEPVFLIMERGPEPRLVGGIDIHSGETQHELGYWLTPSAWGRGYATEAGLALIELARDALRLPRLRATAFIGNKGSARVLAKLGFRDTGRIVPRASLALGREVDAVECELDLTDARTRATPLTA